MKLMIHQSFTSILPVVILLLLQPQQTSSFNSLPTFHIPRTRTRNQSRSLALSATATATRSRSRSSSAIPLPSDTSPLFDNLHRQIIPLTYPPPKPNANSSLNKNAEIDKQYDSDSGVEKCYTAYIVATKGSVGNYVRGKGQTNNKNNINNNSSDNENVVLKVKNEKTEEEKDRLLVEERIKMYNDRVKLSKRNDLKVNDDDGPFPSTTELSEESDDEEDEGYIEDPTEKEFNPLSANANTNPAVQKKQLSNINHCLGLIIIPPSPYFTSTLNGNVELLKIQRLMQDLSSRIAFESAPIVCLSVQSPFSGLDDNSDADLKAGISGSDVVNSAVSFKNKIYPQCTQILMNEYGCDSVSILDLSHLLDNDLSCDEWSNEIIEICTSQICTSQSQSVVPACAVLWNPFLPASATATSDYNAKSSNSQKEDEVPTMSLFFTDNDNAKGEDNEKIHMSKSSRFNEYIKRFNPSSVTRDLPSSSSLEKNEERGENDYGYYSDVNDDDDDAPESIQATTATTTTSLLEESENKKPSITSRLPELKDLEIPLLYSTGWINTFGRVKGRTVGRVDYIGSSMRVGKFEE